MAEEGFRMLLQRMETDAELIVEVIVIELLVELMLCVTPPMVQAQAGSMVTCVGKLRVSGW